MVGNFNKGRENMHDSSLSAVKKSFQAIIFFVIIAIAGKSNWLFLPSKYKRFFAQIMNRFHEYLSHRIRY